MRTAARRGRRTLGVVALCGSLVACTGPVAAPESPADSASASPGSTSRTGSPPATGSSPALDPSTGSGQAEDAAEATSPQPPAAAAPADGDPGAAPPAGQAQAAPPSGQAPAAAARPVDVVVTYGGWNGSSAIDVGGYAEVVESDGTCTLTLTRDGGDVTVTTPGFPDATTTQCGLTVGRDRLSSGTWRATLSYTSPNVSGSAPELTIEVP